LKGPRAEEASGMQGLELLSRVGSALLSDLLMFSLGFLPFNFLYGNAPRFDTIKSIEKYFSLKNFKFHFD
jgi:hypothetical protein